VVDPVTFREIAEGCAPAPPDPAVLKTLDAEVDACVHRGAEGGPENLRTCPCALLEAEVSWRVNVTRDVCRQCRANGPSFDPAANDQLRKLILQTAFTGTVLEPEVKSLAAEPSAEQIASAVAAVKRHAGDRTAKRFVDSLYVYGTVDAERAVDLIETHSLEGVS